MCTLKTTATNNNMPGTAANKLKRIDHNDDTAAPPPPQRSHKSHTQLRVSSASHSTVDVRFCVRPFQIFSNSDNHNYEPRHSALSTAAAARSADKPPAIIGAGNSDASWLSKLLVRKIEPTKESHSRMLGDKEVIYALHTHNVRPSFNVEYIAN